VQIERAIWSNVSGQYTLLLVTVVVLALVGGAVYSSVTGEVITLRFIVAVVSDSRARASVAKA
jgi:hypothetical protein